MSHQITLLLFDIKWLKAFVKFCWLLGAGVGFKLGACWLFKRRLLLTAMILTISVWKLSGIRSLAVEVVNVPVVGSGCERRLRSNCEWYEGRFVAWLAAKDVWFEARLGTVVAVDAKSAAERWNRFVFLALLEEPSVDDDVARSLFKSLEKIIAYSLSNSSCKRRANISSDSLQLKKIEKQNKFKFNIPFSRVSILLKSLLVI